MKNTSNLLRKRILTLTKRYYKKAFRYKTIPGKNQIPVSGRVFDHRELLNLVDSPLDFWLTEGRYNEDFISKYENKK